VAEHEQEDFDKKHGSRTLDTMHGEDDQVRDEDGSEDEDDLERERAGSADLADLSKTKLTQKDYVARAQSAKARKGKYGVTVPKPFGFDTRDKKKALTIREHKVDAMVREKRLEESALVKY
jgi:hypothetical protein